MSYNERGIYQQFDLGDTQHPTFLGMPMGQWWHDLQIWEWFLNEHPDIGHIIEIGTSTGGFATYLAMQCRSRGADFSSFDNGLPYEESVMRNEFLRPIVGERLFVADTWGDGGKFIRDCLATDGRRPILIFCDGGDKIREYKTFAPLLTEQDFLAVHDWVPPPRTDGEFHQYDIDESLTETLWGDLCDRHDAHVRFFRKRRA